MRRGEATTARQLLSHLRASGRIPLAAPSPQSSNPLAPIERRYEHFLVNERGVSRATVENYLPIIHAFLSERFATGAVALETLNGSIAKVSWTSVASPVICFLKSTGSTHSHTSMPCCGGRIMTAGSHTRAPPHRPRSRHARPTHRMGEKLASDEGRAQYAKRKWISEAPNGWIKEVLGFRRFSLRGVEKVRGEWHLVCLALNIKRMRELAAC